MKSAIPELRICGVEPVSALLDQAVARGSSNSGALIQGQGQALPFADKSFDAVCEFATLHHVSDPAAVVSEMLRVSKKAIFLSDCNRFGLGHLFLRLLKLALYKAGLCGAFNQPRTAGKGYRVTAGDGVAYSCSVRFIRSDCAMGSPHHPCSRRQNQAGKLDASIAHQWQRDPLRDPRMVRISRAGSNPALHTEHFDCPFAR
jgi:SAM-dependent methyltransferase